MTGGAGYASAARPFDKLRVNGWCVKLVGGVGEVRFLAFAFFALEFAALAAVEGTFWVLGARCWMLESRCALSLCLSPAGGEI